MEQHNQVSPVWAIDLPSYVEDRSTEYFEYREVREARSDLSNVNRFILETQDRDSFFHLPSAYIKVDLQATAADGTTPLTSAQYCGLVNNAVLKVFRNAELQFDNHQVQNLNDPGFAHLIKTLVEQSAEHMETVGQTQFWHADSFENRDRGDINALCQQVGVLSGAGGAAVYRPTGCYSEIQLEKTSGNDGAAAATIGDIRKNPDHNAGFKVRVDRSKGAVSLQIPLGDIFDICRDFKRCIKGPIVKVLLDRETSAQEYIYGDVTTSAVAPKAVLSKLALWIPALRPNPALLASVESKLASGTPLKMKYAETQLFAQTNISATGNVNNSFRIPQNLRRPLRAYVVFQLATRRSSYEHNSMTFDHIDLSQAEMRLNGVQYPAEKYDVTATDFSRMVSEIHRVGCKSHSGKSLVTMQNWRNTYPILVFDFESMPDTALERVKAVDLELRWRSSANQSGVYNCYVVVCEEKELSYTLASGLVKMEHVS